MSAVVKVIGIFYKADSFDEFKICGIINVKRVLTKMDKELIFQTFLKDIKNNNLCFSYLS